MSFGYTLRARYGGFHARNGGGFHTNSDASKVGASFMIRSATSVHAEPIAESAPRPAAVPYLQSDRDLSIGGMYTHIQQRAYIHVPYGAHFSGHLQVRAQQPIRQVSAKVNPCDLLRLMVCSLRVGRRYRPCGGRRFAPPSPAVTWRPGAVSCYCGRHAKSVRKASLLAFKIKR